jgi:signal transduction histidine kinase
MEATPTAPADALVISGLISFAGAEMSVASIRTQIAVAVLVTGALMMLALVFSTAYVMRPVERLTKVADRLAAGDRDVALPIDQRNEVGVLSCAMVRMAEEISRAAKDSEQAGIGRMANMIAHDLRNALSSVKMNLQILLSHHRTVGGEHIDGCEAALDQVRYMEHILNDMLTFARPRDLDLDWIDLGEVIRTCLVSVSPEAARKSIHLKWSEVQKLQTIRGDRTKLIQMMQNILENSIQAAPVGGRVVVETRALMHESRAAAEIKVTDNGAGIAPEVADSLFEPFVTTRAKGTGLGLAIVQRIVKQHAGQISLVTAPEGGAVATVILPIDSELPAAAS